MYQILTNINIQWVGFWKMNNPNPIGWDMWPLVPFPWKGKLNLDHKKTLRPTEPAELAVKVRSVTWNAREG